MPLHSASVGQLHVVERVDIAHRAEGIAPIHVLQVGSPLAKVFRSIQPTRRRENKRAQKEVTSKILLKLFKQSLKVQSICGNAPG
jgi:hypothetical protein